MLKGGCTSGTSRSPTTAKSRWLRIALRVSIEEEGEVLLRVKEGHIMTG